MSALLFSDQSLHCKSGPYFRYNTYRDMINTPFAKFAPCWDATLSRLLLLPFTVIAFILVNSLYPNHVS